MEPIHAFEYELTSELATEVQRTLVPWELRRGWRRDLPFYAGAVSFAVLIIVLGMQGWILPGVGGGLICLIALFAIGAVYRRLWIARGSAAMLLHALYAPDRRVRIELTDEGVSLESEYFRGKGAWSELEEVVVFPGYWLLRLSNGGQVLIPDRFVVPEIEGFIRAKAEEILAPVCHAKGTGGP